MKDLLNVRMELVNNLIHNVVHQVYVLSVNKDVLMDLVLFLLAVLQLLVHLMLLTIAMIILVKKTLEIVLKFPNVHLKHLFSVRMELVHHKELTVEDLINVPFISL